MDGVAESAIAKAMTAASMADAMVATAMCQIAKARGVGLMWLETLGGTGRFPASSH